MIKFTNFKTFRFIAINMLLVPFLLFLCSSLHAKAYYYDEEDNIENAVITLQYGDTMTYSAYGCYNYPTVVLNGDTLEMYDDYEVSFSNNYAVGTATVTITGDGYYYGTVTQTYQIVPRKVSNVTTYDTEISNARKRGISLYEKGEFAYLTKGKDYDIKSISGNNKIGTGKITIKLKGNYTGEVKNIKFKIVPDSPKKVTHKSRNSSSITIKWNKVKGADGYKIYVWKNRKYKLVKTTSSRMCKINGKDYIDVKVCAYKKRGGKAYISNGSYIYDTTIPSKPKITLSSYGYYGVRTTPNGSGGYFEYERATDKKFKKNVSYWRGYLSKNGYVYFNCYKMAGKTVYIRMRRFTYYNGKKILGPWSKVKKYKV